MILDMGVLGMCLAIIAYISIMINTPIKIKIALSFAFFLIIIHRSWMLYQPYIFFQAYIAVIAYRSALNSKSITIKTDEDVDEEAYSDDSSKKTIKKFSNNEALSSHEENSEGHKAITQLQQMQSKMGVMYHEWEAKQFKEDTMALQQILSTPEGRLAYARRYNVAKPDDLKVQSTYHRNYALFSAAIYQDEDAEMKRIENNFNFNTMFKKISNMFK